MRLLTTLLAASLVFSCATEPENQPHDGGVASDQAGHSDVTDDAKTATEIDAALADVGTPPVDAPSDLLPTFDFERWEWKPCRGDAAILSPVSTDPFEMPSRTTEPARLTEEEIRRDKASVAGARLVAEPEFQQGRDRVAYDLYSPGDRDVRLHYYPWTDRNEQELAVERMHLTVLVDYEPVQAEWVRWNADRSAPLDEATGPGFSFENVKQFELLEFTIPKAYFPEQRAYEISLAMQSSSSELKDRSDSWRMVLYNGGYEIAPRPCAVPVLNDDYTPIEAALKGAEREVLLFSDILERYEQARTTPIEVEGGETIRFFASEFRSSRDRSVTVAQPAVNGEPLGEPFWFYQGAHFGGLPPIDARFSFDYTVPETPGTYDVHVLTWLDPYETWRLPSGEIVEDVTAMIDPNVHSDTIRLVVPE